LSKQLLEPYQSTGPSGLSEDSFDWHHYTRLVRQRWKLVVLVGALVLAAALVHFVITPESYRATTTLQIEQRSSMAVTSDPNPWLEAWIGMKYYPTQYRLLESRGLAERVVLDLGLIDDPRFTGGSRPTFGDSDEGGGLSAAADEAALARLADRVLRGLSVEPEKDTELVRLSYVGSSAEMAARIANGVADAFIDWGIETRTATVGRASDFLGKQIDTLKQEINEKEQQLQSYGRSTDILNLDPQSNVTLQRLDRLNEDYIAALGDRLQKEARYNELRQAPADTLANRESQGLVSELQREQLRLESEYETRLRTYKPEWPEMVDLEARIDEGRDHLDRLIGEQTEKARGAAFAEFQTALRREQSLESEINRIKAEVMDQNASAVEFRNLEMEIQNRRQLLDEMLRRLSEAGVSARLQSERETNVRVIDRALVPQSPFRPSLPRSLAAGLLLGLGLGVGLVVVLHLLDRTLKGPAELQQRLGLPVLSTVPDLDHQAGAGRYGYYEPRERPRIAAPGVRHLKRAERDAPAIELLPETSPRSAVSEAYRSLRTALMLSSAEKIRLVAVTSPESGDGKTVTAVNLAVVMAQLGLRTLLVDGDLRRPRLHKIFERPNGEGLVNVLAAGADPQEVLLSTTVPHLTLCPSGPHPPNPSELLASHRMTEFLQSAQLDFEMVVVDTPPALVVTDAVVIGSLCDGLILCLQANKTLREDAEACVERLRLAEIRILGAVLNRFRPVAGDSYSRRYYSYEAYSDDPEEARGSAA
jgi:capsular exopolysaccharide synthesis family protein